MNKGSGKYITVKFTEEIVGEIPPPSFPEYKFYRWYITSKWSSYLYLYEIEMFYQGTQIPRNSIISIDASEYYSSYAPDRAFDGSVSSYWYTRGDLPQWISVEFDEPKAIDEFRWHTRTTSYKPQEFILQGSHDGVAWEDVFESSSPQENYWAGFNLPPIGEQNAFKVTGQEYQYVNGPLMNMEYEVEKVEKHPTTINAIILTMKTFSRFPTAEGSLQLEYDASVGSLSGRGGAVESFTESFLPTDLMPEPNPGIEETLMVAPAEIELNFIKIEYKDSYAQETITAAPAELELKLIYVGVINP